MLFLESRWMSHCKNYVLAHIIIIIIIIIITFDRFAIKDSYTWNITHNTESTAV